MVNETKAEMYFKWNKSKLIGGCVLVAILAISGFSSGSWIFGIIALICGYWAGYSNNYNPK